jgi:hypothetical protein
MVRQKRRATHDVCSALKHLQADDVGRHETPPKVFAIVVADATSQGPRGMNPTFFFIQGNSAMDHAVGADQN